MSDSSPQVLHKFNGYGCWSSAVIQQAFFENKLGYFRSTIGAPVVSFDFINAANTPKPLISSVLQKFGLCADFRRLCLEDLMVYGPVGFKVHISFHWAIEACLHFTVSSGRLSRVPSMMY